LARNALLTSSHVPPAIAFIGSQVACVATPVKPIPSERAVVVPASPDVVPEVPAVRMQPGAISLPAIVTDGSPIAHQPVTVGS